MLRSVKPDRARVRGGGAPAGVPGEFLARSRPVRAGELDPAGVHWRK
ncbi:MAG: hypothetical protein M0C28_22765 [Candidatus Moduliflexus flocculans]|nr:hypothetical protein [Candidatus Moduliflexus flocculans]